MLLATRAEGDSGGRGRLRKALGISWATVINLEAEGDASVSLAESLQVVAPTPAVTGS